MEPSILCVDDEPRVLDGVENHLGLDYRVVTAGDGIEGLSRIEEAERPFDVILSDMRMPRMNGARFLAEARARAPDSTRILLTGEADIESAVEAVNDGGIFRFLLKPCPHARLRAAVDEGAELFRLRNAERDLLEQTLRQSVLVLADVLGLAQPEAFGRANRARRILNHLGDATDAAPSWELELAATLSQLGCLSLPPELVSAELEARPLPDEDRARVAAHPMVAAELLERIPRMSRVADLIRRQVAPEHEERVSEDLERLRIALDFDAALRRSDSIGRAVGSLSSRWAHRRPWLDALGSFCARDEGPIHREVRVTSLAIGMVLDQDVRGPDGRLWIAEGHEVTSVVIRRLVGLARDGLIVEPIRVTIPA